MRTLMFAPFVLLGASSLASSNDIGAVVAHPPVDAFFSCTEHFEGQFKSVGDALGTDCVVVRLVEKQGRAWLRPYEKDGAENDDWFGWSEHLLSPCDCKVTEVYENPKTNKPGVMGEGRASSIRFRRDDGVEFVYGHVRNVTVKANEEVSSGQPVAMIGNNGYARSPHVHVGAWKGDTPLQIRWNQKQMKLPPEFRKSK